MELSSLKFKILLYTQNDLTSIHELACTEEQPLNDMVSFLGRDGH